MNGKRVCLFLDDEAILRLDELRAKTLKSKSKIVKKLLHFFGKEENEKELIKILKEQ